MGNGSVGIQVSLGGRWVAFTTNQDVLNHITLDIFRAKAADLDTIGTDAFDYVGSFDVGIYRGAFARPSRPFHSRRTLN
jgi:hypothetical protein